MDGIYKAVYSTGSDKNEGIAFMDNGKMYGADMTHAFHGIYSIKGTTFQAQVTRAQHAKQGVAMGGGGNDLSITGTVDNNGLKGQGSISGSSVKLDIVMQKIKNLYVLVST